MMDIKQKITVVWVEDNKLIFSPNQEELEYKFKQNFGEFELNLIYDADGSLLKKCIKEDDIDILVTDYNLEGDLTGIDLINSIRKEGFLVDVLFYSAQDIDLTDVYRKTDPYGFVEVIKGKDNIADPVLEIIGKNLRRCSDIVFLRGLIISRVIDIEQDINAFFVSYFKIPAPMHNDFYNYVLENKYSSLVGKSVTIDKILKSQQIKGQFKKLSVYMQTLEQNRNLLAHCKRDPADRNKLVSMGEGEVYDRQKIKKLLILASSVSQDIRRLTEQFST